MAQTFFAEKIYTILSVVIPDKMASSFKAVICYSSTVPESIKPAYIKSALFSFFVIGWCFYIDQSQGSGFLKLRNG